MMKAIRRWLILVLIGAVVVSTFTAAEKPNVQGTCGENITGKNGGDIASPGFPDSNYPPFSDCQYTITAPTDNVVVPMGSFRYGEPLQCFDKVLIYRTGNLSDTPDTYCGNSTIYPTASTGNKLIVQFQSDQDIAAGGFVLNWYVLNPLNLNPVFDCDFDGPLGICPGWSQSSSDAVDWIFARGPTPSRLTGPTADHTTGTDEGKYAYLEASQQQRGTTALLLSPTLKLNEQPAYCLDMWYHSSGDGKGSINILQIFLNGEGSFLEVLDKVDPGWQNARIPLLTSELPFKIGYEAVRGRNYKSDVAIDDILLLSENCENTNETDYEYVQVCEHCQHQCVVNSTANTAKCDCFKGYALASDGQTCNDINECLIPNICENVEGQPIKYCHNSNGTYSCFACSSSDRREYYKREGCCKIEGGFLTCGKSSTNGRIVDGEATEFEKWPWQVYISISKQVCGGSIVNENWIVSAGHCVENIGQQDYNKLTVIAGVIGTVNQTSVHQQTRDVAEVILHPDYTNLKNDIALIRVSTPFNFGTYVKAICMPNGEKPKPGDKCFATGYGNTTCRGSSAVQLHEVALPVVDYATCNKSFNGTKYTINHDTMVCAGYAEGGKDACQGVSGGPYVCQRCKNCDWYLAGITSFGIGCADAGRYGVFTNVENFENWVQQQIGLTVTKDNAVCDEPTWSSWQDWSDCSVTCNGGTRSRSRTCNGARCAGDNFQTENCNTQSCSTAHEWSNWSKCSVTCGGGTQTRSRKSETESQECNAMECPQWGPWSDWTTCSTTCGGGMQTSSRSCQYGNIGDVGCEGKASRSRECSEESCPVWGSWGMWLECSKTCGTGRRMSSRVCINGTVGQIGCLGSTTRNEDCNPQLCPKWRQWSQFGPCNATCGGGTKISTRQCKNGEVGQVGCTGKTTRRRSCGESICPVFNAWESYGPCDESCGPGKQTRTRTCPQPGLCPADKQSVAMSQQRDCNLGACQWNAWGPYGDCSVTCGTGEKKRIRTCSARAGKCIGTNENTASCTLSPCSTDPCSGKTNLESKQLCSIYAQGDYCVQFEPYMLKICALDCCKKKHEITPVVCFDSFPTCNKFPELCLTNPYMQINCPKTCNRCV